MKPKWILALILVIIGLAAYIYFFTGKPYENRSTAEPVIKVADNVFDVSVDECIDILNQEIKSENLAQIPKHYEVIKHDGWTTNKAMVSKNIMFRFVTYDAEGKGIVRIGLSVLDSFKYEIGEKSTTITISKAEKKASKKYFEIICKVVRPNFNAKTFMKSGEVGTTDFELDGMTFLMNQPSFATTNINDEGSNYEDITVYEAISSKALYKKYYDDTIIGDDDIYFHYLQGLTKIEFNNILKSLDKEKTGLSDNSLPMLIAFAIIWWITLIAAFYLAIRERKEKGKLAMVWKVILAGQILWIVFSMVQIFIFFDFLTKSFMNAWMSTGFFSSGAMVGIIVNTALIYSFKRRTNESKTSNE